MEDVMKSKRPFFPNFVDPLPPDFVLQIPVQEETIAVEKENSIENTAMQSSEIAKAPVQNQQEPSTEIEQEMKLFFIKYFNNVCPDIIFQNNCSKERCKYKHELPEQDVVRNLAKEGSSHDIWDVYKSLNQFQYLRNKYLQMIAELIVDVCSDILPKLIHECDSPEIIFHCIVPKLIAKGYNTYDAIKLLIENCRKEKSHHDAIVSVIGTFAGSQLPKFLDFINKVCSN